MDSERPSSNTSPLIYLSIGFIMGAVVVGTSWLGTRESELPQSIVRNVSVIYMYETDPGSASGTNDLPVESILFHSDYVVMTRTNGQSILLAVDRLRQFSFAPADAK